MGEPTKYFRLLYPKQATKYKTLALIVGFPGPSGFVWEAEHTFKEEVIPILHKNFQKMKVANSFYETNITKTKQISQENYIKMF